MALEDKIEDLSTRVGKAINDLLPDTWYQRSDLPLAQQTSIQIYKTSVMINGKVYKNTSATTLSLNTADSWDDSTYATASKRAGVDFYIYACVPASGTVPVFKLSANSTVPTGYSAETSRKIGGFHCLCFPVGTISGHPLSGYVMGDILPLSVWDLKFHATAGSEGMVYKNGLWVDIYLASWDDTKLASKYKGVQAHGLKGADGGFSGESFEEYAHLIGKQLISREYFKVIAEGSNEMTNYLAGKYIASAGAHKDSARRRMISNCGCEDCCGLLWQWTSDVVESGATWYNSLDSNAVLQNQDAYYTANKYLTGRVANREESVWEYARTSSTEVPSTYTTSGKGSAIGLLRRLRVGGPYNGSTNNGTRSVACDLLSSCKDQYTGARLVSLPYYS